MSFIDLLSVRCTEFVFDYKVIMTRSRTRTSARIPPSSIRTSASEHLADSSPSAAPTEFTSIAFPVKALKILIHDLQSSGESATFAASGGNLPDADDDEGVCVTVCRVPESDLTQI